MFDEAQASADLPTVNFPHKGQITKAIIFDHADTTYLIKVEKLEAYHRDGDEEEEKKKIEELDVQSESAEAELD